MQNKQPFKLAIARPMRKSQQLRAPENKGFYNNEYDILYIYDSTVEFSDFQS